MVRSKIIHLKKIYKFNFNHFLVKRTVFVLSIKNDFYKIKKFISRSNYARYEKMLTSEIVHLIKIYKCYFNHFLVKRMVFVLFIKNDFYKIEKFIFRSNYARYEKMLTSEIVHLIKFYKCYFDHFLVKHMVFVLSIKNDFYKIKKKIFRTNFGRYEKKVRSKIIHLKKIYKFHFNHFLVKRMVFVLSIKNDFYKIKKKFPAKLGDTKKW